ncbi:Gfo/Idh/MocA family protein [Paenibacillus planticolens]|uniref:Gfo/Idh/MocA family oxidoreductase n=1 Tax=Paenibacillus planticolens TaxID=2654976 RepID=A0ABX1ZY22_9BACL|nr:Gfo/Idh/MocA family oxidoreductase [Paenibacillus planticolens]NOV03754.1 gfo/Idh/MocA family oxidoreductase [Paenibacillus planticolens]
MLKPKVRIGMIGYKFMGKAHSHAYRDLPFYFDAEAEPVMQAIAGREREGVEAAANKMGWASFETDWRKLLERKDIDLIDIGAPNNMHVEIAIAAAEAGKHILCEKPLAMNVEEARRMRDAVKKAGVVHMICHNYRFVPAIRYAKQLIDQGKLGQIYHIRTNYLQDWIMDPAFPLVWRLRKEACGSGTHGDLMAHSIDLARYLVGEISEVSGMMETFIKQRPLGEMSGGLHAKTESHLMGDVDVDDAVAFMAKFENGAVGVFEATRFGKGNRNSNRFEINGSKGSIRWDVQQMNELELYLEEDPQGIQGFRKISCTETIHPYSEAYWPAGHIIGYEHTFINLIHELMRGVARGESPSPNFDDGYRNQLVLQAVSDSAALKKWVSISE